MVGRAPERAHEDRGPVGHARQSQGVVIEAWSAHDAVVYSSRSAMTTPSPFSRVAGCDLCRAARMTPWHHEDDICWVAECDVCDVPMVVWRYHGTAPPAEHRQHMLERLREVAARELGDFYLDDHMRNIPDHYHAHARPVGGFFGHGLRRRPDPGAGDRP